jgi:hypothetical protein
MAYDRTPRFRQREAARAMRAATQAGLTVTAVEVTREGTIHLVINQAKPAVATPSNDWDSVLVKTPA